jgi:hypothetical protein
MAGSHLSNAPPAWSIGSGLQELQSLSSFLSQLCSFFALQQLLVLNLVLPFLENFRFLKSKIQQFTRRTDIDAGIRALVFCCAGVLRVSRPELQARK